MTTITQTAADLQHLADTDPTAYLARLRLIRGACTYSTDTATRPDDYDTSLQEGQPGHIPPVWTEVADTSRLADLGIPDLAALDAAIAALDR